MPAEKVAGEGGGLFEHQPDRSGKRPASFLGGFTGYMVTNGYTDYNWVLGVTYCGRRTHARWKWRDAMPDGATGKISNAVPQNFGSSDALESRHKTAKIHGDI